MFRGMLVPSVLFLEIEETKTNVCNIKKLAKPVFYIPFLDSHKPLCLLKPLTSTVVNRSVGHIIIQHLEIHVTTEHIR